MSLSLPPHVISQARATHEANMPDTCRVDSPATVWDEDAQASTRGWETIHEGLPCRLPIPAAAGPAVTAAGEAATPVTRVIRVPAGTTGIKKDMRVTITASQHRPTMVGLTMWVSHVRARTYGGSLVLDCRDTP